MYKQVDNYYAMMQVAAGRHAYALDFSSMTIRDVGGMTVSEVDNNLTYITEEPQSEENMGKTDVEEVENGADECEKNTGNTEAQPVQQVLEEKTDVEEAEKPKSSSADTDSEEVKNTTKANAKEKETQLRLTEEWVDLYAQGMSKTQIAKKYVKAISTVSTHIENYLKEAKLKIDLGKFMALRNANWDNKHIALEFHVTEGAITLLIERGM